MGLLFKCLTLLGLSILYFHKEAFGSFESSQRWNKFGWLCPNEGTGVQKCIKLLSIGFKRTKSEAISDCSKEFISGDIETPRILELRSKNEEQFLIPLIESAATLLAGRNINIWLASKLQESSSLSSYYWMWPDGTVVNFTSTTGSFTGPTFLREGHLCSKLLMRLPEMNWLRIFTGRSETSLTYEWQSADCNKTNFVVCQTSKLTVDSLMLNIGSTAEQVKLLKNEETRLKTRLSTLERSSTSICGIAPNDRVDCGYSGIRQWQCWTRGCCYDDEISYTKHCFHSA